MYFLSLDCDQSVSQSVNQSWYPSMQMFVISLIWIITQQSNNVNPGAQNLLY